MSRRTAVRCILGIIIAAFIAYCGYSYMSIRSSEKEANEVLEVMKTLVPGLGVETGISTGHGRDPLAALSIHDIDIVGCIEIPVQDIMVPVTASGYEREGFVTAVNGSPVKGHFMILGGRNDRFRKLSKLKPGDRVIFTDIDGVRYTYEITTQYHLKKWDEGDNDLMLCYESDKDTYFVAGCTSGTMLD